MTWESIQLGEFVTLKRGYDLPTSLRVDGSVPVVSSSGVTGHHDTAKVEGPGVVTGRYGTLGEVFFITDYVEWFVHLRFPGHEHVPINGGVPEGWERKLAADVVEINPRDPVRNRTPIRYVPMGALSISGMVVDLSESEIRAEPTSVRFMNGDTLFPRITPCLENGKTGYVDFLSHDEVGCGSTEFIVLRGRVASSYSTYCLARTSEFRAAAIKSMVGSSGRQRVQVRCLQEFVVSVPPPLLRERFDRTCEPLFRQITALTRQTEMLAKTRDALLRRLMNREVVA